MTNRRIFEVVLSVAFLGGSAAPARADILQTLTVTGSTNASGTTAYYDSLNGYDFSSSANYPPATDQYIGTFSFSIPTGDAVTGIAISGTFGNFDSPTTSLADFFLGDSFDGETAVDVANCNSISQNCFSDGNGPSSWTDTLTATDLANITSGLANGTLDFSYKWVNNAGIQGQAQAGQLQYVYAGAPQIDIAFAPASAPEPGTVLICFGGVAGIAAVRRFRKV